MNKNHFNSAHTSPSSAKAGKNDTFTISSGWYIAVAKQTTFPMEDEYWNTSSKGNAYPKCWRHIIESMNGGKIASFCMKQKNAAFPILSNRSSVAGLQRLDGRYSAESAAFSHTRWTLSLSPMTSRQKVSVVPVKTPPVSIDLQKYLLQNLV